MNLSDYVSRAPDYYLSRLEPEMLTSLSAEQLQAFRNILDEAMPKPSPKMVDLRFVVDLIFSRFYVVLFLGKDRRQQKRRYIPKGIARIGNAITMVVFLLGANLFISAFILLSVYLLKSAIGINLLPGHSPDLLKQFLR